MDIEFINLEDEIVIMNYFLKVKGILKIRGF